MFIAIRNIKLTGCAAAAKKNRSNGFASVKTRAEFHNFMVIGGER